MQLPISYPSRRIPIFLASAPINRSGVCGLNSPCIPSRFPPALHYGGHIFTSTLNLKT